jgi:hypothetical protein
LKGQINIVAKDGKTKKNGQRKVSLLNLHKGPGNA